MKIIHEENSTRVEPDEWDMFSDRVYLSVTQSREILRRIREESGFRYVFQVGMNAGCGFSRKVLKGVVDSMRVSYRWGNARD